MRWFMRPGSSRISGCSVPPNATFISWKPRQMPNIGMPRATQASISGSASASRSWSYGSCAGCGSVRKRVGWTLARAPVSTTPSTSFEQRGEVGDVAASRRTSAAARRRPRPPRAGSSRRRPGQRSGLRRCARCRSRRPRVVFIRLLSSLGSRVDARSRCKRAGNSSLRRSCGAPFMRRVASRSSDAAD